jgi:hypothetical protein
MTAFLSFLKYTNIILTVTFIGTYLILNYRLSSSFVGVFASQKEQDDAVRRVLKYRKILNTIFRVLVGILLISIQFPYLYKLFAKNSKMNLQNYGNQISPIISAAGFIIIFTVSKGDILNVVTFFKSLFHLQKM